MEKKEYQTSRQEFTLIGIDRDIADIDAQIAVLEIRKAVLVTTRDIVETTAETAILAPKSVVIEG